MSNWISVKDRLPEESGYVLVHCVSKEYGTSCEQVVGYSAKYKAFNASDICLPLHSFDCVTHWMPLPEPPEEV